MSDTLPALTDRWTAALASHGVRLRRSKVTELMARLLGHRSSNELAAAAVRGDLDPPRAVLGDNVADDDLVALHDPVSSGTFAIPRSMLEAPDRAMAYIWSPWGNLLDVRDARRTMAGRDALPAGMGPRSGLRASRIDLHALVRRCDAAGAESIDVRSDGQSGQVASTMPDGAVTTHYDGDAMSVVAILHALVDRREPDDEATPDTLVVQGAELAVDGCERLSLDHVRLHLMAGRRRRTRVMRIVRFTELEWSLVETAALWADDGSDTVCGLVREGLAAVGDGHLVVPPEKDDGGFRGVPLDMDTDDAVRALSARTGHAEDDVVRALVVAALPGNEGVARFRAREAAALRGAGADGAGPVPTPDIGKVVPEPGQVMRSTLFLPREWARVDAVSFKTRASVVDTVRALVKEGLDGAARSLPFPGSPGDEARFQRVYLDEAVDGMVADLAGRIRHPVADTVRWLVLAGLERAEARLAEEGWITL